MTDEDWRHHRNTGRCEAPACTAPGKRRIPDVIDLDHEPLPDLRHMLCLCSAHFRALADRVVVACWGVPPTNVVWRLGLPHLATWYLNERRLTPEEVEQWMQTSAAHFT